MNTALNTTNLHPISTTYMDGDLVRVSPDDLVDMTQGNVRKKRNPDTFRDLVQSIKAQGVVQPIIIRWLVDSGELEVLAGYGRWEAAKVAKLDTIPCIVRIVDDVQAMEIHLAENFGREDLSLVDEVQAAKRYMSLYKGDRKSAAVKLGWPITKLNERLELTKCTDKVLEQLANDKILGGHALKLSSFDNATQDATVDKIISEGWTVAELAKRANERQIPLSHAKFDTAECTNCPHNTQPQGGLFGFDETQEAKCSKPSCFKSKVKVFLASQIEVAEEKYGKVIFLSQSIDSDRNTVSAKVVGEVQFETGCLSCENRAAVLRDEIVNCGEIIPNQCLDTACFKKCTTPKTNEKKEKPQTTQNETNTDSVDTNGAKASSPKAAPTTFSPSKVLIEEHQKELAKHAAHALNTSEKFKLVLEIIGLAKISGYSNDAHKSIGRYEEAQYLMAFDIEQLTEIKRSIFEFILTAAPTLNSTVAHIAYPKALMNVFDNRNDFKALLKKAWKPTEIILNKYNSDALCVIAKKSGFVVSYEQVNGDGSFKKLAAGRKPDLVKALLSTTHDWSTYAPDPYLELLYKI